MPFSEIHLSRGSASVLNSNLRVELCVHVFDFLMIGTHVQDSFV